MRRTSEGYCLKYFLIIWFAMVLLTGCGLDTKEASGTGVYFDTVVDIKVCGDDADRLLKECFDICNDMEKTLSAHDEESELYKLNHRDPGQQEIEVSEDLMDCISKGLYFSEITDGAFDITVFPLRQLWDFESEHPSLPAEDDIEKALEKVDYRKVHVNGNIISFDDPDTMIDAGGVAKGCISAKLKAYLISEGCTSALINLGGNVSAVGKKPDGSSWNVGIQEPFADRGTVAETVKIDNGCVVSSGTYERYFTVEGKQYHHILDTMTGYPVETSLEQATVIGEDDALCDALSTICMILGREKAESLIEREGLDVTVLFMDKDTGKAWYGERP